MDPSRTGRATSFTRGRSRPRVQPSPEEVVMTKKQLLVGIAALGLGLAFSPQARALFLKKTLDKAADTTKKAASNVTKAVDSAASKAAAAATKGLSAVEH